jgi:hypothetical protein
LRLRVLDDAEYPRVVTDDRDIRLLLHVDRQDAQPVLVRAVPLLPTPETSFGDPPRRGYVILQPGAWVDVTAREGAMAHIAYGDEPERTMSGWIDAEALGTTMTITMVEDADDERPEYVTKRATKLLSRPGGKLLIELDADESVVAITPRAVNGYRLVEHQPPCEDDLVYVGFVRDRDLLQPTYGMGHLCGSGAIGSAKLFGEAESAPRITLDAGWFLLDADTPRVVGCVLAPTEVADLGDGRYAVATIWGPIPVRLAPAGFDVGCGR